MKLLKSAQSAAVLTAIFSAALLTLSVGGCGKITEPSGGEGLPKNLVVAGGKSLSAKTSGDGKISFSVTGIDMDLDRDSQPIVFFYDDRGYGGGRATGGFHGELRNYKLKYYGSHGIIESEAYHHYRFRSTETYQIELEWKTGTEGYVQSTVNGVVFNAPGAVAESFVVGVGYPPAVRRGFEDAVYTDIVWPKGSTALAIE